MSQSPPPPAGRGRRANPYAAAGIPTAPAGVGRRLGARLIDQAVLVGLTFVVGALIAGPLIGDVGVRYPDGSVEYFTGPLIVAGLLHLATVFAYVVVLETTRGQTFGKMIVRLQVLDRDGGRPRVSQSLRRNAFYLAYAWGMLPMDSTLPILLTLLALGAAVLLTITRDRPEHRGWHDRLAGTRVVTLG